MMKRQQWFGKLRLIYGLCILGCNCMWVPSVCVCVHAIISNSETMGQKKLK